MKSGKATNCWKKVFSSSNFLIAYLDVDFNYIRVNQAYAEVGGHPISFYAGKNHFELNPGDENRSIFWMPLKKGVLIPCMPSRLSITANGGET